MSYLKIGSFKTEKNCILLSYFFKEQLSLSNKRLFNGSTIIELLFNRFPSGLRFECPKNIEMGIFNKLFISTEITCKNIKHSL